jgi:phage tail sheath protein FI
MKTLMLDPAYPKNESAAIYYPWIRIADPLTAGAERPCAPCGAVAGIFARTDSTRGVWKAPAGLDATLLGVSGAEYTLTDAENSILNPLGINCIRAFSSAGRVLWGARTMHGADNQASEYKYIPVRRLALFIQESIFRGLQWVVFEPNGESLWRQIHLKTGAFMHNLYTMGAFRGTKPQEAYFIKCDKESTTQTDIDKGVVNVWVGFAPLRPAEFIIIQIQQSAGRKPGG